MSSILSARRQRLPNETLTYILLEMDPWDVWPLRSVCHNFNAYIMRYLAPRRYLPMTAIFVRAEDSWIFTGANRDLQTPSTPSDPSDSGEGSEAPPTTTLASPFSLFGPFGAQYDHRGRKLAFLATRVPDRPNPVSRIGPSGVAQPIAEFLPAIEAERDIIQMKLNDTVQIIIRVGEKYFRHVTLPTLVVDRESLIMSLDWRELFNAVLCMPERVRRLKDAQAWPSKLWIPDAFAWVDRPDSDFDSDEDSDMSVSEPSADHIPEGAEEEPEEPVDEPAPASEGGEGNLLGPLADVPAVVLVPIPLVAAPPLVVPVFEELDEPDALTELTEVLPEPESDPAYGFSRDELEHGSPFPPLAASHGGASFDDSVSYGEGATTAEEALREAFAPSYALLLDYEESSSEGGRSDVPHDSYEGVAYSIDVTSDEYAPRTSREGALAPTIASSLSMSRPADHDIPSIPSSSPPHAQPAIAGDAGDSALAAFTPPSGSGDDAPYSPPYTHDEGGYGTPNPPRAAGESFLVFEDTSAENTSSDSAGLAGAAVTYRSIGVQVHPVMLSASEPRAITRHHSWP